MGGGGRNASWQGQTQEEWVSRGRLPLPPERSAGAEPQDARQCLVRSRSRGRAGVLAGWQGGVPGRGELEGHDTPPRGLPRQCLERVWGVLTALGLRLVQSRGQCVGLAPEDSGWVWRSVRAALWAVGP